MSFVVTAHQPNFLPGWGVVRKLLRADAAIFLDEVQFTSPGWSNRNKMPDGKWLTVPVEHPTMVPFNRVRISDRREWREKAVQTLRLHYAPPKRELPVPLPVDMVCREILRPYRLLIGLNLAVLDVVMGMFEYDEDATRWHFQSHLDGGHAVVAQGGAVQLRAISERLAMMVEELGGTTYLSGPSGRNYLDEKPFFDRQIRVDYYQHDGTNECALGVKP